MNRNVSRRIIFLFCFICYFNGFALVQAHEEGLEVSPKGEKYYLSVCAIFRNEARFLKEWIEFHRLVGVEHFYLLNNLSTDDYQSVLAPYIKEKIVELYQWNYETDEPGRWSPIQTSAYEMIIKKSAKQTKWLAIIDTDEFLFPVQENNLESFLKKYEKFSCVCVSWQMFGTSGVSRIPSNELLIDLLTLKAPTDYGENIHVKSIVKPSDVKSCPSPHFCFFRSGHYQVNEDKVPFEGPFSPYVSVNKIRINHYWSRDEDFFYNTKVPRRDQWGEGADGCLLRNDNINKVPDFEISRFSEELRKRVFSETSSLQLEGLW